MGETKIVLRYSTAFRQKVVSEIETGRLTIARARRLYAIHGSNTIRRWMRALGNPDLITKVVRVEMVDEPSRVSHLENEKQRLESALAQAHLKILVLESTIDVLEEKSALHLKKKTSGKLSTPPSSDKLVPSNSSR